MKYTSSTNIVGMDMLAATRLPAPLLSLARPATDERYKRLDALLARRIRQLGGSTAGCNLRTLSALESLALCRAYLGRDTLDE